MLKKVTVFLLVVLGTVILAVPAMAQESTYSYVKVVNLIIGQQDATINNVPATLDQPAYAKDGRTLVPFRFLGEALGAEVTWDNTNKIAGLKLNDSEVIVTIGSKTASINGVESVLDVPAEVKEGRTFIPLRFVSEALGASVDYDAESQTVTVTKINTDGWENLTDSNGMILKYPKDWTVSGNLKTKFNICSPLGTNISVQLVQNETAEIMDKEKALHDNDGFQLIEEGPVDDSDPDSGQMVVFIKPDLVNMDNSDIISVLAIKYPEHNLTLRVTSNYSNIVDFLVIAKMFVEE